MVTKWRDTDYFFTFSDRYHYSWKVLLDRNGRAVLSGIVLYFFGLERHNFTKKDPPGVFFFAVFSDSLNRKRRRAPPLSGSLKPMTSNTVEMTLSKHMLSPSSLSSKNNRGTCQKWWGKWNYDYSRVGSTSLLNMALCCFVSGWGHLILFSLASMG